MQKIVFLIYHGRGHFNACFRLAKILQAEYEVVFTGFVFFQNYVESQGFRFYALKTVPFGLGFEHWVNTIEKKKNIYWHSLQDRWNNRLYNLREADLRQMLEETQPDCLLIDSWGSTDFIVLYQQLKTRGIKTAIIHTMLSNKLTDGLPPLNSLKFPDNKFSVKSAHLFFHLKEQTKTAGQWIKYLGKTNKSLIRKQIKANRIPKKYISSRAALFSPGLEYLDELILVPREFEFPSRYHADRQRYLGFMIDHERIQNRDRLFDEHFISFRKKIAEGCRLIYCSFGTVEIKKKKKIKGFLQKLISIAGTSPDIFLFAGSNSFSILKDTPLSQNIYVLNDAPQLEVLSQTSLFITHGGLNSVKEAIYAGVPMLVYPVSQQTDHNGISGRIVYHQFGLRGDLVKDSVTDIHSKMNILLSNDTYRNNIQRMKKIDESYSEENVLNVIKNIQPM